ncbi:Protein canopy 3 [Halocaridina rubra]|uniref:Protein canopy 3 n=1 Tax=Halocaridina rubra TaxID=373956 RepID=A0AAN8WTE6_HALRR
MVSHAQSEADYEGMDGIDYATDCEVCKLVTKEVAEKLQSLDSSDVIETGYGIDGQNKKTKYSKSKLRLAEALDGVCKRMLEYRIHKDSKDSRRFAKGLSQTIIALHKLVNKGVKVNLGIPLELWDEPSIEITYLKMQCERFIADNEDNISEWYYGEHEDSLQEKVCNKILEDRKCLSD